MADIKIGGKLRNIQDVKGTIADASQISFNETDIATELELLKKNVSSQVMTTITSADIDYIITPGIYNIENASNAPGSKNSGILAVIDYSNNNFKQIWENDGEYSYRYCSLQDVLPENTDTIISDGGTTPKKFFGTWTILKETPDIDLSQFATKSEVSESISKIKSIKKYSNYIDATDDIENLEVGDVVSIINANSKDYTEDYDLYIVVMDTLNNKDFKKLEGGGTSNVDTISFTIESVDVELNGKTTTYENFDSYIECDIGAKITFNYKFTSINTDMRGRVYFKRGTTILSSDYKYPTDEDAAPSKFVYNTKDMASGTYTFSAYATDSANRPSKRVNIKFRIGGLSVTSDFNENTVLSANQAIEIPIEVSSADIDSQITATYTFDEEAFSNVVEIGRNTLTVPAENVTIGTHTISIKLTTATRQSNILSYNIIVAESGAVYAIADKQAYETPEGTRVQISLRTIQLGGDYSNFYTTLKIYSGVSKDDVLQNAENDSLSSNLVQLNNKTETTYKLSFGTNLVQFTGLTVGSYVVFFKVTSDDTTATPAYLALDLVITENNYNIQPIADSSLKCCFKAEGYSNNTDDRENWHDLSGNNVTATFNNFNWINNGWLEDENGQTALTLNSGAYVELGITPFDKEVSDGMTISIDFSTKDILNSEAKVVSCLYETEGTDTTTYYLRDAFGNYIKNDFNTINNNIVKYFKYAGGYCWIDGETYPGDGIRDENDELPYEITFSPSERCLNYNLGNKNPDYDGKIELKKCTGQEQTSVTKQTGFYIDTQYAVLSNSASPANINDKFYLNFSEDTRTRIDFIISRKETAGKEVYYFPSMIGYTNGCLSLMKQISDTEKFIQASPVIGRKFKVYLGCKATYDRNGNIEISDTGSSKIYSFRIYDRALTPDEILKNYAAEIPDQEKKKKVIDSNDILEQSSVPPLPEICLIGAPISDGTNTSYTINKFIMQLSNTDESQIKDLKKVKEPAYLTYTDYSNDSNSWKLTTPDPTNPNLTVETRNIPIRLQFQGTSSMVYPLKNYKFKCYDGMTITGQKPTYGGKKKFNIGNGIDENTFCIKADYMDSSHCNNTGSANFIADYNAALTGETPASKLNPLLRTTIYGYPVLIYYKEKLEDTEQKFIGVGNLNLDKSCTDSYGLNGKVKDAAGVKHDFGKAQFIDDEFTKDILDRVELSTSGLVETGETLKIFIGGSCVDGKLLSDGNKIVAVLYNGKAYKVQAIMSGTETKYYVVLQNPKTKRETALLSEKGYIRSLNNDSIDWVSCSEYKANSGARGAGGFGDYSIESVASDIELRYPDDGDIEDENYAAYLENHADSDISFKEFKNPFYYHVQRMIKWVCTSDRNEFRKNLDRHFNRKYLMDYYLTILLLGGVDSLGKNLMVGTWGPENHLYITTEEVMNTESENYDRFAFKYNIGTKDAPNMVVLTPTMNKNSGAYEYAKNADGQILYFSEDCFDRVDKKFRDGYSAFEVTTIPGECIWYPTFYDIDTICGLDNSGQLLYDVDIEVGDQLRDGTAIYNTADSNLWTRVKNFLHEELGARWQVLRDPTIGRFTKENLIENFYYNRQISKIPEKYYNKDCLIKYIYEGPNKQKGSGSYLYCIHGSRYEQIKRWYSQRMYYLDSMFGSNFGASAVSLRFNYSKYDESFNGDPNYYASYPELAAKNPDKYRYDSESGKLYTTTGGEIAPIKFKFKTYQPAYVGVKWFNGMKYNGNDIVFQRVSRNETKELAGNVKTSGDAEVFIYGGSNIKEVGPLYEYNVKQLDFGNLTKLSKLELGATGYSCVINELKLGTNNTYISELSVVNCGALTRIDVSACVNLRNLNMTGSGITSVELPTNGGALEAISYSNAITEIKLENFVNLSTVNVGSLNNITSFVIKNCPKILGSKELPNPKAWALLQQTNNASSLTTIELTSYGYVEPKLLANGEPFFFPDKYYSYETAPRIKGEIYYRGTVIPNNYTQFADRFPELTITYNNITDASGMFENYKNINLIGEAQVYIGDDIYGNHQYTTVKYWKDESKELQEKWHNNEMYEKYGSSSTYSTDINYYQVDRNTYLRLLSLYDDYDLDLVRAEIKKHLLNFTKFTNVNRMFKNMTILDYLDPDTFNNIDLSEASTNEMFAGCINLRYFETPNDIVKCEKRERYIDADGNIVDPSEIEDFNEKLASGEITKEEYWYDPLNRRESGTETVITAKGMRNIGNLMFQNCKKLRCYIRKLSDNSRITISSTAFYYPCFNASNDSQPSGVTMERPAIFFEHSDKDLLATTTNSTTTINNIDYNNKVADDSVEPKLYYAMNIYKERVPNYSNKFINFSSDSWLRECYFNVVRFERFKNEDATNKLSYAVISENGVEKKVLVDVINGDDLFNKGETIYDNKFNIKSITIGALRNLKTISALTAPIPEYDCLDTTNPRFELENSISTLFAEKNFTSETASSLLPENLKKIYITDTKIIKTGVFTGIKTLSTIGFSEDVLKIEDSAFKDCAGLENILWDNASGDGSTTPTSFNKLESIGNNAFMGCLALRELKLSDSVKTIGDGILSGCSSLKEIVYSNQLKTIPAETFRNCKSLTSVSGFSKNIALIGANAFNSCESLSLFILQTDPEGNPTGKYKFALASGNTNTESISYFEGLHTIGESAFYNTGLAVNGSIIPSSSQYHTKLEIPATMRYIGDNAFRVDYPTQISESRQIELIWKKNSEGIENYEGLYIGSYAFYNLRMAWSPSGLSEELINDCIYIPRLISNDKSSKGGIGTSAFAMQGQGEFTAVFCRDSDEIGDTFVSRAKKIVYNYVGIYDGSNNWRYLLATRNSENIAYVQKLTPDGTSLMIPKSVSVNDVNYDIIQILSGALDRQIVLLEFATDSKLELIERNIFTKDNSSGLSTITGLPENLVIEPDNNFKNTLWYNSQQSDSIVKLGKYIIGCRKTTFENNTLDLSAENANIIYDDAFSGIEAQKVTFGENITAIYDRAFKGAHIDYSNINDKFILPSNLTYIGKEAFFGCKFKNITIPKTVQFIGSDAFTQNQNVSAEKGTLQYLEFEQGCKFTDFPLKLQTEITATGVNTGVSAANITLNTLFIPTDLGKVVVNSSVFKQASQIRNLILGNFETDGVGDNMVANIKLYKTPDGTKTTDSSVSGAVEYTNDDGEQIYTYKFFDNMCKQADAERFKDTFLETTDARSYCPCGDTEDIQGFNMDLDISNLRVYEDATYIDGTSSRNVRELTAAEILMIIAGFTSKPSKDLPKLRLRTAQNTLIQPYIGIYSRARTFLPDVIR